MPAGLVEEQCSVASGSDVGGDCGQMQVHHGGVAPGQDETDRLALLGQMAPKIYVEAVR